MHLWEHPHNSPVYLAFKSIQVRLATSEPLISRCRKSGVVKLLEHYSSDLRHLCAKFGYFRGMANPSNNARDIELQDCVVEIPHPQQARLDQIQQRHRKKGRFFTVNTPKKSTDKAQSGSGRTTLWLGSPFRRMHRGTHFCQGLHLHACDLLDHSHSCYLLQASS